MTTPDELAAIRRRWKGAPSLTVKFDRYEPASDFGADIVGTYDEDHLRFQEAVRRGEILRLCWVHSDEPIPRVDMDEVPEDVAELFAAAPADIHTLLARIAELERRLRDEQDGFEDFMLQTGMLDDEDVPL